MGMFIVSHLDLIILLLCLGAAVDILFTKPLSILRCALVITLVVGGLLGADLIQPHLPSPSYPSSSFDQNPTHSASAGGEDCVGYDLCLTVDEVSESDWCHPGDDYCFTLAETEAED